MSETLKGTIRDGASHEDMETDAAGQPEGQRGVTGNTSGCAQRGWIINGCYWCGVDGCVNPGWLMAQCSSCGKWYVVSR